MKSGVKHNNNTKTIIKYIQLYLKSLNFFPLALETLDPNNSMAIAFLVELGHFQDCFNITISNAFQL